MFNTKFEVDKHVESCLKKINSEKERNNRSYTFAKLYYSVGDYEQARRYVNSYLSVKPKSSEGHYLLGGALEKLGKKDAALDAYRTSLQLDPKQNNLVLKVCELLASDDLDLDMSGAKYFCQLAENVDPHNPSILNLKEKLIMAEQKNPDVVIKLLIKELENRPTDVNLRVRLLRNFIQHNQINEAYKHVHDIEEKNFSVFSNNLTWYEVASDVLVRYRRHNQQNNMNWSFWCLFITVLDKLLGLRLDEKEDNIKESSEYIGQLFVFDQALFEASNNIDSCLDRQLANEFLNHYSGQMYLHFAVTIFKQAKKDLIPFKEAASITLPLLFAAYHNKPVDLQNSWINHLEETQRKFLKRCHLEASYRCSQSGHTLLSAAIDRKSVVISKATQHSTGMWKEQLFKKVFVIREQQLKMNSSFFVTNQVEINLKLPSNDDLLELDEQSFYVFPDSLEHYVWVSLNNELSDIKYPPFQGLQYSVKNLNNCGAETLNLLDVQAFVYCATLCAKSHLKNLKQMMYYNIEKPNVLPEAVTGQLVTVEQAKFLKAAYKMYRNEYGFDAGEMRMVLIRGIEGVRCIGRHGLDVAILVKLAKIFAEKAEKSKKQSEIEACDARAELYWKAALPILEKMRNNQAVTYSSNRLFEYKNKDISLTNVCNFIDKGKLFLGVLAMKRKEHEKALNMLEELKDPYASFHQAQIYKQMADQQINQNKEVEITPEMKSQNVILLSKARDCYYLTLDRLREPSTDKNHALNLRLGTEIEKIERSLLRADQDCSNRNECDGMSDENGSSGDSTEHFTSANFTNTFSNVYASPFSVRSSTNKNQSTPMRLNFSTKEARPSPERLDAQLRQLIANKDATMGQVIEQNKIMLESHRCLVDELRGFKEAVYNLSGQVDNLKTMKSSLEELKDIKRSVNELKNSVDELQNFRTVSDVVYELKKEIASLKKDSAKHQQQVNDDLYVLDDDYPEYNIGGNLGYNPGVYPNYPSRIPPTVPPPAALYPHGLYPPLYGSIPQYTYPNLGLTQSALTFGADQQLPPDLRGLANTIAQTPLYPQPPLPQQTVPQPLNLQTNVNPSLLTGQTLSQVTPQQPNLFKETKMPTPAALPPSAVSTPKSAPVNVVITSSDPLPTLQSSLSQPVLSVTIPPQHIKGGVAYKSQPHNYQIPLPTTTTVSSTPSVLYKPPPTISTEGMLSNVAPPIYSAVSEKKSSKSLGIQIEKSLEETFSSSQIAPKEKIGANEKILFECPAKLYTFVNDSKEFKEKGSGLFKLIENKEKNTVRILMRHDFGKVIAHHFVTKDLKMASTKENAYYWSALDFSDGKQNAEKFCLKFKNADDSKKFYESFEKSKQQLLDENDTSKTENKDVPSTNTTTFGGFVFSSSPIFKPKEEITPPPIKPVIPEEKSPKTSSPFANFSFSAGNKTQQSLLSSIGSTPPVTEFKSELKTPDTSRGDTSLSEEFVPTAEFQPVIPLPDMVEVKTGEENAEVLFSGRSKLLRFDADKKEWKERGLGNMKILKEKTLIRLLMRREQIHKVCCNHQLLKSMNFQYMPNNFKAVTWCAQDFADEVLKNETFAIRFKTEEQTTEFLKCILNAQASLVDDNVSIDDKEELKKDDQTKKLPPQDGFGDKFKPVKGNWECKTCYITNDKKDVKCVACESPRPVTGGKVQGKGNEVVVKAEIGGVKTVSGWGDSFKPKAGTWECQSCLIRNEGDVLYCVSCESPKDDTVPKKEAPSGLTGLNLDTPYKFNFGIPSATGPPAAAEAPAPTTTFKFGSSTPIIASSGASFAFATSPFTFQPTAVVKQAAPATPTTADEASPSPPTTKDGEGDGFVFGSPAAHEFEFKPRSPRKSTGPGDEESDGSYLEEECDAIYFKPVIPLPNKVEVKTGEEDEEVLYCHRSKLFRFTGGEWKERGIGDLKILRRKDTGKLRVLMRRDQVLKICLNHALHSNIEYLPKDDKTWLFAASDFSEGEVINDQFCVRFKTPEIAQKFKKAVDKALDGKIEPVREEEQPKSDDSSDVEIVSETIVTAEELKEAQKLLLPPKFFAYRQLPLCTCEQCIKDDEYFKGTIVSEGVKKDSTSSGSSGSSLFQTPTSFVFGSSSGKKDNLRDMLATPSLFAQTASSIGSTDNVFVTPTAVTPVSSCSTTTAGNLFGSTATNLFGTKQPASTESSVLKSFSFTKASENIAGGGPTPTSIFASPSSIFAKSGNTENISILETNASKNNESPTTKNIFGLTPKSTNPSSLFAGNSLFGSKSSNTPSAFGGMTTNLFQTPPTATPSNIFGAGSVKASGNIFATTTTSSMFQNQVPLITSTATSIFGSSTSTTTSLFGATSSPASSGGFGSGGVAAKKTDSKVNPFGSVNTGSLFGTSAVDLFGSGAKFQFGKTEKTVVAANPMFGGGVEEKKAESTPLKTINLKEGDEVVLKSKSDVTFSSLAAQSQNVAPAFEKTTEGGGDMKPFAFFGAGAPVFVSKKKQQDTSATLDDSQQSGGGEEAAADEEYDPHYEPIIPMPEAIVVSTGEEDETEEFNERAKLFRYDADLKEWKERGIGPMKILHHPENGTYRLLLRREQVHKVVLNQLITPNLELQPMSTSDRAWVWAGHNFVEDQSNLEKLAIKFKFYETAQKFYGAVQNCISSIVESQEEQGDSLPATIQDYGLENVSSDSEEERPENYRQEEDYEDDDDEDDPYEDYEGER